MAIITTNDQNYKNIADKIRSASEINASYTPEQMPEGIGKVYDRGYTDGWTVGYGDGHYDGFGVGEENYRQFFWDRYQNYGERTNYNFAFAGPGWTEETLWPQYDITAKNGYQMFAYCGFAGSLKARLNACKVQLKFAEMQTLMNLFSYANQITELGVMDFSAVAPSANNIYIFNQCTALHTIEKLVPPINQPDWTGWFTGCSALENIRIQGTVMFGGMNFADCPKLTRESILSILNALANRTGTTSAKLTLGAVNLAKLTDADKAIATNKNWILA